MAGFAVTTEDLKDGSGIQVFEADTQEALIDKLIEAHVHATRKIRELTHENKRMHFTMGQLIQYLKALADCQLPPEAMALLRRIAKLMANTEN